MKRKNQVQKFSNKFKKKKLSEISDKEVESNSLVNQKLVDQARYEGKLEGLAWGILTLFRQGAIKKPSEMVTNVKYLGLPKNIKELEIIESCINLKLNNKKIIDILVKYLKGDKMTMIAHIIYETYVKYDDIDEIPENYNISKEIEKKLKKSNADSAKEVLSILQGTDIYDNAQISDNVELIGDGAN